MGPNKVVHMMFLLGGLILFFLANLTGDWIWGSFVRNPNEFVLMALSLAVALGVGITMYRNERIYGLATDVSSELRKVTWPTMAEVRSATLVVIVAVMISAAILGLFDAMWSALTDLVYG